MGQLIPFSKFDSYLIGLKKVGNFYNGTILDTNILVALSYEVKANHEEVIDFLDDKIIANDIGLFTNIVTSAEFINIYRRILLTENLADSIDESSKLRFSKASRTLIKTKYGLYKKLQETQGKDLIFNEGDLKRIRDTFPGVQHSGKSPWPELTKAFLGNHLQEAYDLLMATGIKYLSPNEESQRDLFTEKLFFKDAITISSSSGLALFDSMILNSLKASVFSFAITCDADLAYATLVEPSIKDIVAPDSIVAGMKNYNFKV